MKKLLLLFIAISGLSFAQVTFNPGIRAGANFSHLSNGPISEYVPYTSSNDYFYSGSNEYNIKTKLDFYIGFQANVRFSKFYALQPEIIYTRQGARFDSKNPNVESKNVTLSYIGSAMVNKLYLDKFNIHLGPTLEILVDHENIEPNSNLDLGILFGAGYDITKNLGVEARIKKGFARICNDHTNVTFQTGVYYTFKLKK